MNYGITEVYSFIYGLSTEIRFRASIKKSPVGDANRTLSCDTHLPLIQDQLIE
jgi:hypothetical protein